MRKSLTRVSGAALMADETKLAALLEVERSAFPKAPWGALELRERARFLDVLLREDGSIAGYLVVAPAEDYRPVAGPSLQRHLDGKAYLAHLAVDAKSRSSAIGSVLLDEALSTARRLGRREIALHVRALNQIAAEFYRRRGFETTAMIPGVYRVAEHPLPTEDALEMIRPTSRVHDLNRFWRQLVAPRTGAQAKLLIPLSGADAAATAADQVAP